MITRRRFVGGALAAAVAPRLALQAATPAPDAWRQRVVVVGAGLAGLTTALDLVDAGWDVVVLEARDRVGGRVFTRHAPFSEGLHAEAGGESIDEAHHALLAMIRRFGLLTERRQPQKPYDAVTYYRGERTRLPLFLTRRNGRVLDEIARYSDAEAALGDGIDPSYPENAPNAERLDATSADAFIRSHHLSPEADFIVRLQMRSLYDAEPRDLSLLFIAQQAAQSAREDATGADSLLLAETMRIRGGNSQLPHAMANALGPRVHLSQPVARVEHGADYVRVTTTAGAAVDAAWAVLATPMQPLRRVAFAPALPNALAAAVAGLDLGDAVKITREYSTAFWTPKGYSGFTISDLPFALAWSPTDSRVTARGLLSQFITGDAARYAASLAPEPRIAEFLRQLDRVYPEAKQYATARTATMAWRNEPYTGGGYAIFRPGQMAPYFSTIRRGAGRLRFAGEHTCNLAGYMESAVRSGHRVAKEIGLPGQVRR